MAHAQRGLVVGPQEALDLLSAHAHKAFTVKSWDNHHSPKTQDKAYLWLRDRGYMAESVFDAAHGRRYMLFVYKTQAERQGCWQFLTRFSPVS